MRSLLVTAVFFATAVHAADFRGLDFGTSCDSIRASEEAQNSVPIPWSDTEPEGFRAFKGRAFDREVTILYVCLHGQLRIGNYFFPFESMEAAVDTYRATYDALVAIYGVPFLDTTPWQPGSESMDPRFLASDPSGYRTSWRTLRAYVSINLLPFAVSQGEPWRVTIIMSASKT